MTDYQTSFYLKKKIIYLFIDWIKKLFLFKKKIIYLFIYLIFFCDNSSGRIYLPNCCDICQSNPFRLFSLNNFSLRKVLKKSWLLTVMKKKITKTFFVFRIQPCWEEPFFFEEILFIKISTRFFPSITVYNIKKKFIQ